MTDDGSTKYGIADEKVRAFEREAGLKHLSPGWAKIEIVLGLSAVAFGLKLLMNEGSISIAGGALFVLGAYLAMAGNRSHVYQSQNRQTGYLRATAIERDRRPDG